MIINFRLDISLSALIIQQTKNLYELRSRMVNTYLYSGNYTKACILIMRVTNNSSIDLYHLIMDADKFLTFQNFLEINYDAMDLQFQQHSKK